jgi:hypothetical protein
MVRCAQVVATARSAVKRYSSSLFCSRFVPHDAGMTLDQLAQAMRGMPRDALIMIRTPEGLRRLVWVKAAHIGVDGTEIGAGTGSRYAIILEHDGLEPRKSVESATIPRVAGDCPCPSPSRNGCSRPRARSQ